MAFTNGPPFLGANLLPQWLSYSESHVWCQIWHTFEGWPFLPSMKSQQFHTLPIVTVAIAKQNDCFYASASLCDGFYHCFSNDGFGFGYQFATLIYAIMRYYSVVFSPRTVTEAHKIRRIAFISDNSLSASPPFTNCMPNTTQSRFSSTEKMEPWHGCTALIMSWRVKSTSVFQVYLPCY